MGGVETHTLQYAKHMINRGHTVFFALPFDFMKDDIEAIGAKYIKLRDFRTFESREYVQNILNFVLTKSKLKKLVRDNDIDILHIHGSSISSVLLSSSIDIPTVCTVHGIGLFQCPRYRRYFDQQYTGLIAISHEVRERMNQLYPHLRVKVIPNGIDLTPFRSDQWTEKLVHISRMDAGKIEATIALIRAFRATDTQFILQIIGDGGLMSRVVEESKGDARIRLMGYIPPGEIPTHLSDAYAVIGAGRVAIEGMASGKPIIMLSPAGFGGTLADAGIERAMATNFSGRGIGKVNTDQMAKTLLRLIENPDFYRENVELSKQVAETLDIENQVVELEEFYKESIESYDLRRSK